MFDSVNLSSFSKVTSLEYLDCLVIVRHDAEASLLPARSSHIWNTLSWDMIILCTVLLIRAFAEYYPEQIKNVLAWEGNKYNKNSNSDRLPTQQQEEQQQLGWTTVDFRGYILRGAGRGAGHEPIRSLNRWLLSELIQFDTILTIFLSKFTCHHGYWVYTSRLFWVNLLALLQSCCHFLDTLTSLVFSSCTCSYDVILLVSVTVDISYKKGYGIILLYLIMMVQDDFQVLSLSLLAKFWVKNGYTNVRCEWSH